MTTQQIVGWSCIALTPVVGGAWAYCVVKLLFMDLEDD